MNGDLFEYAKRKQKEAAEAADLAALATAVMYMFPGDATASGMDPDELESRLLDVILFYGSAEEALRRVNEAAPVVRLLPLSWSAGSDKEERPEVKTPPFVDRTALKDGSIVEDPRYQYDVQESHFDRPLRMWYSPSEMTLLVAFSDRTHAIYGNVSSPEWARLLANCGNYNKLIRRMKPGKVFRPAKRVRKSA